MLTTQYPSPTLSVFTQRPFFPAFPFALFDALFFLSAPSICRRRH